tara:strand:+ start:464 stop:625 length:162 start_codon:yes stop_codon:yes gene_type:complete
MKKYLILIFILTSCSSENLIKKNYNFEENMSFDDFKIKLDDYAKNNPYPNVDK